MVPMSERVSNAEEVHGDDAGDEFEGATSAAPATEDAAAAANAADGSAAAEHAAVESGLSSDEDEINNGVHAAATNAAAWGTLARLGKLTCRLDGGSRQQTQSEARKKGHRVRSPERRVDQRDNWQGHSCCATASETPPERPWHCGASSRHISQ